MSPPIFAIGDLQGCHAPLATLLAQPALQGSQVVYAGDLVNRGPASLATLRHIIQHPDSMQAILGNHDLHLLAIAAGIRQPGKHDTLQTILAAPDRDDLIDWLRHRPLALHRNGFLLVHAGVLPQWSCTQTLELAQEIEQALRGPHWRDCLAMLYRPCPNHWSHKLNAGERLQVAAKALTRLRFCTPQGEMEFSSTDNATHPPAGYLPWFDVPDRRTADTPIVFGHWSTLGLLMRPDLIGLDTGCVWGGKLTAVRLEADPTQRRVVQVACPQAQDPLALGKARANPTSR